MTPKEFDDQIQAQLDVVTKILAASEQSQETAKILIAALDKMRTQVEISLEALKNSVTSKINSSADTTATKTATLIQEKFIEADKQASLAAMRYERAAKWLGLKIIIILTSTIIAALGIAWIVIINYIPSLEEINLRRQELAAMEARALNLQRRGANLKWSTCSGEPCFRTNEGAEGPWGQNGETWRRAYKDD